MKYESFGQPSTVLITDLNRLKRIRINYPDVCLQRKLKLHVPPIRREILRALEPYSSSGIASRCCKN